MKKFKRQHKKQPLVGLQVACLLVVVVVVCRLHSAKIPTNSTEKISRANFLICRQLSKAAASSPPNVPNKIK